MIGKILNITLTATLICLSTYSYAESNKENEDTPYKKAEKYFFEKKFEMAEILFLEIIKNDPENAKAYSYLGDVNLRKKKFDDALSFYRKALDIEPGTAENYFRIGQIYYYKKLAVLAIENFEKAVSMDKRLKFAYYHIGLSYLMLQRDKQNTIKYWETYTKLTPEDPQYEKILRVIELLKDPNFSIPAIDSDISIEEALLMGGSTLKSVKRDAKDKKAGSETKKTNKKIEEIYLDDDL